MMRGTAVVANNIGGLAEIVQHEQTGLLVPPMIWMRWSRRSCSSCKIVPWQNNSAEQDTRWHKQNSACQRASINLYLCTTLLSGKGLSDKEQTERAEKESTLKNGIKCKIVLG
ncbi:hypothetical protein KFU94_71000 [Chloroflexi bacterium TSY]|nr:hypothetical protein [Chloroflexi bacterium TSY]